MGLVLPRLALLSVAIAIPHLFGCGGTVTISPDDGGTSSEAGLGDDSIAPTPTDAGVVVPMIDAPYKDASVIFPPPPFDAGVVDSGACNSLYDGSPFVEATRVASDAPPSIGGTILPGTYYLTKYVQYTGKGGKTGSIGKLSALISISGNTIQSVSVDVSRKVSRKTNKFEAAGNTVVTTEICGGTGMTKHTYTASEHVFQLTTYTGSSTDVLTFELPIPNDR